MNVKLVIIFAIYLAIFISGLIITISLGVTKSNFDGECVLYLDIFWTNPTQFPLASESFGSPSTCDFVIYLPLVDCILYPFIMLLFIGYIIVQSYNGNVEAEKRIKYLPLLILNTISFILIFIAACIVSTGRNKMCSSIVDGRVEKGIRDATCHDAQNFRWPNPQIRASSFVRDVVLAEVVLWVCLIWWLLLIVPEAVRFWRNRATLLSPPPTAT